MASSPATGATPPGLDLGGMTGLDEATAQARLVAEGTNELPGQRPRTGLAIANVIKQLRPLRSATIVINGATETFPPEVPAPQRKIMASLGIPEPGH